MAKKSDDSFKSGNDCTFTKTDYLFLARCLDDDYQELIRKKGEIERRYLSLREEAKKRWYYMENGTTLDKFATMNDTLPF